MKRKIIVIGGGAAGFFGAISAKIHFPESEVIILEKNRTVLNKVRVSGGGRCNLTQDDTKSFSELVSGYPRGQKFLRKVFEQWNHKQTADWFRGQGVALKTEPDSRMFPASDSSETIIDCLYAAITKHRIQIHTSCGVSSIEKTENGYKVLLQNKEEMLADRILITTGGNPQALGYQWISQLGHQISPPVPSLFTFNIPDSPFKELMGVSVSNALVKIAGTKLSQEGGLLITHWGLSGPAVLKLSAWGARVFAEHQYQFKALINWNADLKSITLQEELIANRKLMALKLVEANPLHGLPNRLWRTLTSLASIPPTMRWADIPTKNLNRLVEKLTNFEVEISGKTTFKEEFVTCGGVVLNEVNPNTLESLKCTGIYFAGEVLDIDGITGGYNFQSAWSTAWVAGKNIGN